MGGGKRHCAYQKGSYSIKKKERQGRPYKCSTARKSNTFNTCPPRMELLFASPPCRTQRCQRSDRTHVGTGGSHPRCSCNARQTKKNTGPTRCENRPVHHAPTQPPRGNSAASAPKEWPNHAQPAPLTTQKDTLRRHRLCHQATGSRVRVIRGPSRGIEGELIRYKKRSYDVLASRIDRSISVHIPTCYCQTLT